MTGGVQLCLLREGELRFTGPAVTLAAGHASDLFPQTAAAGRTEFSLQWPNSVVPAPGLAQLSVELLIAPLSCSRFNTNKQP